MSNIEILTKGYADSVFASGPVVKEITSSDGSVSVFVDGPNVDLKVKSGGDALEGPYVSITGYNTVNLMSGSMAPLVSTAGIKLDGTDVDIEGSFINLHNFGSGTSLKFDLNSDGSIYINGPITFKNTIKDKNGQEITGGSGSGWDGRIDTSDVSITGENTVLLMSGVMAPLVASSTIKLEDNNIDIAGSVFINGPVKFSDSIIDKNGQEITGGGSASLPHIKDEVGNTVFISGPAVIGAADHYPESPALIFGTSTGSGDGVKEYKGQIGIYADSGGISYFGTSTPGFFGSGGVSIYINDYMGSAYIGLKIGDQDCHLSKDDLRKLREILDAHS